MDEDLEAGYQQMAQDERREAEALEWVEATMADVSAAILNLPLRGALKRPAQLEE